MLRGPRTLHVCTTLAANETWLRTQAHAVAAAHVSKYMENAATKPMVTLLTAPVPSIVRSGPPEPTQPFLDGGRRALGEDDKLPKSPKCRSPPPT